MRPFALAPAVLAAFLFLAAAGSRAQTVGINSGSAVGTSLTVNTLTTGAVLNVGGASVSPDGRYVTLSLEPSLSTLDGFDTFSTGGSSAPATAFTLHSIPFRSAVVGRLTLVEHDHKLLAKPVKALALKDTSLKAGLQKLAAASDTNIVLGIRGMQQAGIDVDTPHTFSVAAGTLKDALLSLTKTALPNDDLVLTADDGVLSVVSQLQDDAHVVTRTYDLTGFVANLPRVIPPSMDLGTMKDDKNVPTKPAPAAASPKPTPASKTTAAVPPRKSTPARPDSDLLRLITSSVRPEIWKCNGGKYSDIAIAGSRVVVTAPESVQVLFESSAPAPPPSRPMYIGVQE